MIELPGGFQQKNRTLKESALVELEEEVGIKNNRRQFRIYRKNIK
ncbi:MAG: hypothetical protein ABIE68_05000 [bacterium]